MDYQRDPLWLLANETCLQQQGLPIFIIHVRDVHHKVVLKSLVVEENESCNVMTISALLYANAIVSVRCMC